ncbi:hypothetical protein R69658_07154 [Paraburkholderia aspalathi]|uniref:Novel STAND NTPase 3 domain-containing protein n=1 Tax=Paraburkholderia aspalathi TaxID=1324617 RepID=A0ABM8T274_9BURK|nr:hypothetical protein [Paraburkholderia aspalathi]MBK3823515.1 recombinase family protein [Paraburkholderia aspalathi]MBK3835329.1 recombinase family protein [Paraburkholderia aspalathi]MBK3865081.1 recombinase family protein [Paraburkholderia aspalathi]CAE6851002.1 hypothetical protein R69658_07154 [Paraburkholderia aspalathi]
MYSVSALVELAKTDLPASISWLNGNSTIKAVSGCAVTITIMVKAWSSIQKAILDWKAKKLASKISEQTHVASFSSTDIRDAITGYVWPDASAIDPADEADLRNVPVTGSLHDAVLKIIGAQRERLHLILLADSGMGKTTFCINFYAKYWKKRNVAIVPLGRADAVEQIHVIPSPQETILFLDAFDEDASAVRDKESRFTELMEAAKNFQHVIVTCRSQFFLLEIVRRIQFHQVVLHRRQSATGLSTLTPEQKELFDALNLPIPTIRSL